MRPDPSLANIHEEVAGSSTDQKLDTLDNKAARDVKRIWVVSSNLGPLQDLGIEKNSWISKRWYQVSA